MSPSNTTVDQHEGSRNPAPVNNVAPVSRQERRANAQAQKKVRDKLNRLVSVTMLFRDAELKKVQDKRQTLLEYGNKLERHMLDTDKEWRSYLNTMHADYGTFERMKVQYVRSVASIMEQLQRPKTSE